MKDRFKIKNVQFYKKELIYMEISFANARIFMRKRERQKGERERKRKRDKEMSMSIMIIAELTVSGHY